MMLGKFGSVGRSRAAWLAAVCTVFIWGCQLSTSDKDIEPISAAGVNKLLIADGKGDRVLLIDPRPPAEFRAGHLPGARNINLPAAPAGQIDKTLDSYSVLVVYGKDPASVAGRAMTKRLMANGYSDVRFFAGGVEEWVARGGTLEVSPGNAKAPE